jgi:hypothetical protein
VRCCSYMSDMKDVTYLFDEPVIVFRFVFSLIAALVGIFLEIVVEALPVDYATAGPTL